MKTTDYIVRGEHRHYLTAIGPVGEKGLWRFLCDCGKEFTMRPEPFVSERQKSCGCMRSQLVRESRTTHGASTSRLYYVWNSMRERCTNPNVPTYRFYGGRGIGVCDRWRDFKNFQADMGPAYKPGLTLDRIDVNGDYSPENCRWVTKAEQANNKRSNRFIDTPKGRMTVATAARAFGLKIGTLRSRLSRGCPPEGCSFPRTCGTG